MPSFRAQLDIMGLLPGHPPEAVMDSATAALGAAHLVEAKQLDVVAGVPRITLRFLVEETDYETGARQAISAAVNMRHAVERVATVGILRVLRRRRNRWERL
ncbi:MULTISPECIES: hypothetical protein [unclassified Arthrobacter]|uniref:hypothetical protein n=1 Tax=unclassified Arthrobacter TaxID=235627 RepID=UPI0009FBEBB3|nr:MULTISPECIES: hypothetical protein [unclassified Arthrobacter]PVE18853.1 hypothetical protein DDA93_07080 [Arthrobacter sp. Bz4]